MTQAFKHRVQLTLKRLGLYHRLKASGLYSLYWSIVDRSVAEHARRELEFYHNLLDGFHRGELIFDIGANEGIMTWTFLQLGARVVAVDPDETNKQILEAKYKRYRLIDKDVTIVNKAVSDKAGIETMWIDQPGSAKNTLNRKWVDTLIASDQRFGYNLEFSYRTEVTTTTLEELVADHGLPYYIKIDVEGYETSVLRGLRHPVPYLSFEVNLPEFMPEGLECVALLGGIAKDGRFNYLTDYDRGLVLRKWLGPDEFSQVLATCTEPSIDVFWKNVHLGE